MGQLIHRRHRYSSDLRGALARNQELRQMADYQEGMVSQTEAARALRRSETFVEAVLAREGGRR